MLAYLREGETSSRLDYRAEIYKELVAGRIVIVDLHLGPDAAIRQLSENLASYLMERQLEAWAVEHGHDAW